MKKILLGLGISATLILPIYVYGQMGMMEGRGMMGGKGMMEGGMMNMSMIRHRFVMRNGIDEKYANKVNPLQSTSNNIKEGKVLYEYNCASCHGTSGQGDGEAGINLTPRPSNIAMFSKMPMATDGYLFWTISEGGVPLQTAMPPFKSALEEDDIWKIVLYLRQL
ncbi:c-type cytochrome [Marinobacter sp.]|uniref:c-type cytochrome n=1 Tax=Marinobacter sp. TaxID=50741 RepID=UPI003A8DB922